MTSAGANVILVVLSALLLIVGFPGFNLYWLTWVALVPLILLLRHAGLLRVLFSSLAVGFIFFSGLCWWGLRVDGLSPLNFSAGALANALSLCLFGLLAWFFNRKIPRWNLLTLPAAWVAVEYMRTNIGFLSFPWGVLGYSQYTVLPVARISAFAGVYGVSLFIAAVNTAIAELIHSYIHRPRRAPLLEEASSRGAMAPVYVLAVIFIIVSISYLTFPAPAEEEAGIDVALIQGNVYFKEVANSNFGEYSRVVYNKYYNLTMGAADDSPKLIIWPSSTVPGVLPYDKLVVTMLGDLAKKAGSFLLIGSSGYDKFNAAQKNDKRYANSAFLFSQQGEIVGQYDKVRLLPFDEYLPLRGYVRWPSWIVSEMKDFKPGENLTVFEINKAKFGVLICWENMFTGQFRKMAAKGIDFMVSMTNEGFTDDAVAHEQMLSMNVFRAIENHVPIARTAPTGISAIIDADGRIIARVQDEAMHDVNVEGYLVADLPLSSERTFYTRFGDWLIYLLLALLVVFTLLGFLSKTPSTLEESP